MIEHAGYMHWAKTHPRVRFELTDSSIPSADLDVLGPRSGQFIALASVCRRGDTVLVEVLDRLGRAMDELRPTRPAP